MPSYEPLSEADQAAAQSCPTGPVDDRGSPPQGGLGKPGVVAGGTHDLGPLTWNPKPKKEGMPTSQQRIDHLEALDT